MEGEQDPKEEKTKGAEKNPVGHDADGVQVKKDKERGPNGKPGSNWVEWGSQTKQELRGALKQGFASS